MSGANDAPGLRVYRWDLDKTYLLTDFDSLRGIMRTAMEPAWAKRAVPGATALVRELGREGPGWRPRGPPPPSLPPPSSPHN